MVVDYMAVFIDQEFGEIPGDSCGCPCCRVVEFAFHAQELVDLTSVYSVYFSFLEHWECDSVGGFRPFKDFLV